MHNHNKTAVFFTKYHIFTSFSALFFWVLLLFAFDSPYAAVATLIAGGVHELGHKVAFSLVQSKASLPRPSLFGFKIHSGRLSSYKEDIITAAAGPLANLLLSASALPLSLISNEAYKIFAVINIATALSNLLPIKGYDGYKILLSLLHILFPKFSFINIIDAFSFIFTAAFCFFSLYLIGKLDEGYWIFLIFFCSLLSEISKSQKLKKIEITRDFTRFSEKNGEKHIF